METLNDLSMRGSRLLREGRPEEAIAAYRALLERKKELPEAWFNLAWLCRGQREFEAALTSYEMALQHGIQRPEEVLVNCAAILSEHLGRDSAAEEALRAALVLRPGYVIALLNLGSIYEDRGDLEGAKEWYEAVLATNPDNGRASARLGDLDRLSGHADKVVPRLRSAFKRAKSRSEDRAEIGFAFPRSALCA